jgi:hypothetical protein
MTRTVEEMSRAVFFAVLIVQLMVGLQLFSNFTNASAQETSVESGGESTTPSTSPQDNAPPADATPGDASPAPAPRAEPPSPPVATRATPPNAFADASGLVMQPIYLAFRIPVAVFGGVAGAAVWAATGGNTEVAQKIWGPTLTGPWAWPAFVRGLSDSDKPAQGTAP